MAFNEINESVKGLLSMYDIQNAILDGSLKIYPFNRKNNLTGLGYNFGTTDFFLSTRRGSLEKIRINSNNERYIRIAPNDTVLTFTKEYVEVDNTLAGTLHSKVKRVSQGLGHISTTLDPNWKGQLLLAINNPMGKAVDLVIDDGNITTLLLYGLYSPLVESEIGHDNSKSRADELITYLKKPWFFSRNEWGKFHKFIKEEFTNSLNGNDELVNPEKTNDTETLKLFDMKKILSDKLKRIKESNYEIGSGGTFFPFQDEAHKKIIKESKLYAILNTRTESDRIAERIKLLNLLDNGMHAGDISKIPIREDLIRSLEILTEIINYELEIIEHDMRVKIQNEKIVKYYRASNFNKRLQSISFAILIIAILTIQIIELVWLGGRDSNLSLFATHITGGETNSTIFASFLGAFITIDVLLIPWIYKKWKSL